MLENKSWSFLCFIFMPFSAGCYTEVVRKVENTFSLFQWGLQRDQAKLQFCAAVRAGKRGSHDSTFCTLISTSSAGLHLPKIAFRRHSYCIPSSSQRLLLCFSARYTPVHKPRYRLCQNGPVTLGSLFPWSPRESPLGEKVTCCDPKAVPGLHSMCWFIGW